MRSELTGDDLVDPSERLLLGVGELVCVHLRDVVEHETHTLGVSQYTAFPTNSLGDQYTFD